MKKLIASIVLLASTTPAFAFGETGYAQSIVSDLARWVRMLKRGDYTRYTGSEQRLQKTQNGTSTECLDAVAGARKEGATTLWHEVFEHFGGKLDDNHHWTITLDQAAEICKEATFYADVVLKDLDTFGQASVAFDKLMQFGITEGAIDYQRKAVERCGPAVDELLAAAVPPTFPYPVGEAKTVAELKAKVCEHGKQTLKRVVDTVVANAAKARAPFMKAGIEGDKLALMLQYDGSVFLPGGAASDNLRRYAAASSLFVWLTSDPDGDDYVVHTVRKYQFKGNKLVRDSEKTYRKKRGANLGAAAFK